MVQISTATPIERAGFSDATLRALVSYKRFKRQQGFRTIGHLVNYCKGGQESTARLLNIRDLTPDMVREIRLKIQPLLNI